MKWLRYCILVLSFLIFSPLAYAGIDPIGWAEVGTIPANTIEDLIYGTVPPTPQITYTFRNNLPYTMPTPLYIAKFPSPASEFTFVDTCSAMTLASNATCTVTILYNNQTLGHKSVSLAMEYGRNIVPLPAISTNTTAGPIPLVTGTVTTPLPANIGAGDMVPFAFTYTNTNNGTVINVNSDAVTINPNPGGSGTLSGISDGCANVNGDHTLLPGQSCTVSGNFTAGTPGNYTLNHDITYTGGTGTTVLSTSTLASQDLVGVASIPLPPNMGAGEQQYVVFTFTNNGPATAEGISTVVITPTGGTFVPDGPYAGVTCGVTGGVTALPAGESCTASGTFTSGVAGPYTITAAETYDGGTVTATTTSNGSVLIVGTVTQPLPPTMGAGEDQHIAFRYTNSGTGTVVGITSPTTTTVGGTFISDGLGTCGTSITTLAPGAFCTYSGDFQSGTPGNYSVTAYFNYTGGTGVAPTTTSSVGSDLIVGSVVQGLPANLGAGQMQVVIFNFKNTGTGTALAITEPSWNVNGVDASASFVPDNSSPSACGASVTTLAPGASCSFTGTLTTTTAMTYTVTASFNYLGGTGVSPVSTTANATDQIVGTATIPLPANLGAGEDQHVLFTFTNTGSGTALGITSPDFTTVSGTFVPDAPGSNTCGTVTSLLPGNSCTYSGTYTTAGAGFYSLTALFNYSGGMDVSPTTTSANATVNISGTATTPLPPNMGAGETQPVVFTFKNNSTLGHADGLVAPVVGDIVFTGPIGIATPDNFMTTCGTPSTLPATQSCTVSFSVTSMAEGAYTVAIPLTYAGGTVTASTSAAGTIMLTGAPTPPLPATIAAGSSLPVTFTFTNTSSTGTITGFTDPVLTTTAGGSLGTATGTCIGATSLAPSTSCTVSAVLTTTVPGSYTVTASETYDGGTVMTSTTSNAAVQLTGAATPPLPATIGAGSSMPVTFTFTNTSTTATVTSFTDPVVSTTTGGTVGSPTGTCIGTTSLAPSASCTVTTLLTTTVPGSYTVIATETYGGGMVAPMTTSNAVVQVAAAATALPATIGSGETLPVTFTFTNNSTTGTATPVTTPPSITSSANGSISNITTNCTTSLLPGANCTVNGTLTTTTTGAYTVTGTLTYGGNMVSATTSSTATVMVTGSISPALPATIGASETRNITFVFKNTSATGTATGITAPVLMTTIGSFGAIIADPNNCGTVTTLAPGATCIATAPLTTAGPGSYTLTANMTYSGGTATATGTTNAVVAVTGAPTVALPSPIGAGEQGHPVSFTFTNNGSGTVQIGTLATPANALQGTGVTITALTDACAGTSIAPGGQCLITGTFSTGAVGSYTLFAQIQLASTDIVTSSNATSTGQFNVKGMIAPNFPTGSIGLGEIHPVEFDYTNNGSFTAYGVQDLTDDTWTNFFGGTCNAPGVASTCTGGTLAPGATCEVTCENFESMAAGTLSATSSFGYAAGNTPILTASVSASQKVVGSVPIPLPATTAALVPSNAEFSFTNNSGYDALGGNPPTITVNPSDGSAFVSGVAVNCASPLTAGSSCLQPGTFTPLTGATSYTVFAQYTYDGGTITTSTGTHTAFARTLTVNNYCGNDVWYAFNGAEVRKGCSSKNACPGGSICNKDADNGTGVCYWANPAPTKGDLHLGAMTGTNPTTAQVLIYDVNSLSKSMWAGSVAGRTGCNGDKACETADCDSQGGKKACPAGHNVAGPATLAQFTLMRDVADKYSIYAGNGINLTMSMGPTDPSKTTPAYDANAPYYCATPGSADPSRIFKTCSWILNPPNTAAGTAAGYAWVKPGFGGACSSNAACSGSDVCGLSYNNGGFAKVCGPQLGYWTASQACLVNSASAKSFFDCKVAMSQPAGDLLKDLNACTNANPKLGASAQPQACSAASAEKATLVQWIKSACPSVSAFPGDTANSSFTCNTNRVSKDLKAKDMPKVNLTDYTINFCPERAGLR